MQLEGGICRGVGEECEGSSEGCHEDGSCGARRDQGAAPRSPLTTARPQRRRASRKSAASRTTGARRSTCASPVRLCRAVQIWLTPLSAFESMTIHVTHFCGAASAALNCGPFASVISERSGNLSLVSM